MVQGQTFAITGASSGLGAALALTCARAGANVALFSPEGERLAEAAERCAAAGGRALTVVGDVTKPADCARLVAETVRRFGGLDCLVANAGISMWASFEAVTDVEVFRRLMEVNYLGAVHCVHYALPHIKLRRGMVVAISSIQARIPVPLHAGYVASKHALQGFCDTLRLELSGTGVGVLTVQPHWLRGTELRRHALGKDGVPLADDARKHTRESVSVEDACVAILSAIRQRRRELIIPAKLKALVALRVFWPALAEKIIMRAVRKQS